MASLEQARIRAPADPAILNDLAVAYLAVAERTQELMPMLRALDAVDAALARDSTSSEARFNRALILGRLFLVGSATTAWSDYLASERDDGWRSEARARLRAVEQSQDSLAPRFFVQRARQRFFALLGSWGTAINRGDRTRGGSLLAEAIALRDSLGDDAADQSVAMTLDWLRRRATDSGSIARIAEAVVGLASGIALHDRSLYDACEAALGPAEDALRALASPATRWAAVYRAACEANQGRLKAAEDRLERTRHEITAREPALLGKTMWLLGVVQVRQGNYEAATQLYMQARRLFIHASDVGNDAAVSYLLTESLGFAGQAPGSEAEAYKGLRGLAPFRNSRYLHNLLIKVGVHARDTELRVAALDILREAGIVARTLQTPIPNSITRWTRAENLAAIGDTVAALAELDTAAAAAAAATGAQGARAVTDLELTRGRLLSYRDPTKSRLLLDRAVGSYRDLGILSMLPAALLQSALLANASNQEERARSELQEAIAVIERRRASFTSADAQAAYYETVENVFDVAIKLELDDGHTDAAFDLLERERVAVRPQSRSGAAATLISLESLSASIPNDMLFVTYAVLADRVAIWYAHNRERGYRSTAVSRDTLAALARRAVLETRTSGAREARTRLFEILLRPLVADLRRARVLAAVPDRELVAVPIAALWNSATSRYVVEDVAILTEPSASFMIEASRAAQSRLAEMSALVVGNPGELLSTDTSLADLPGAAAEAKQVAEVYSDRKVLIGRAADRRSVIEWLSRQAIFHFAGHAVFDALYPERSYLALSDSGRAGTGRLAAQEIAQLSLSKTKIVVLSACRTLPAKPSRSGAVAGIAFSFLRAGAPAIVSTLWDIADAGAGDLVVGFHRGMRAGLEPAEALRQAQMTALRSNEGRRSADGTWAAFVYTGPWTINWGSD